MQELVETVQHNCDIVDARHGDEYGMCTYLLKMRELYRWQQRLPFDGRPIYEEVSEQFTNAFYLDNTDIGDALNFIVKFELPYGQQPIWGIASYTYGESNVVNDATSSRAVSNWQYNEAADPNNAGLSTSDFEIEHRVMINLNYEFNRNSRWSTTVSAFYNHQSGRPYMSIYEGYALVALAAAERFVGIVAEVIVAGADVTACSCCARASRICSASCSTSWTRSHAVMLSERTRSKSASRSLKR